MTCNSTNLDLITKLKTVSDLIEQGQLGFDSSGWTDPDGNLTINDTTLQNVLDKFNDFKIQTDITGKMKIANTPKIESPHFVIDDLTGLFAVRGDDNTTYDVQLPDVATSQVDILIIVGLKNSTYNIIDKNYQQVAQIGRSQVSLLKSQSGWIVFSSSDNKLTDITASAVYSEIKPKIQEVSDIRDSVEGAVSKADMFATNAQLFSATASTALGFVTKNTLYELLSDLNYDAETLGYVVADPDITNCGIYKKVGASGSGTWVWSILTPYYVGAQHMDVGEPGFKYNATTINGFLTTFTTNLDFIYRVGIRKNTAKTWNNPFFKVRLYGLQDETQDVTAGTLVQEWLVDTNVWESLTEGDEYILKLDSPIDTTVYPVYSLMLLSDYGTPDWISVKQTGYYDDIHHENKYYIKGQYQVNNDGVWRNITPPENYAPWLACYSNANLTIEDKLDHINTKLEALEVDVKKIEDTGEPADIYQYPTFGWGSVISVNMDQVTSVIVKKNSGTTAHSHSYITLEVLESSSADIGAINSSSTLIESIRIPTNDWYLLSDGDEYEAKLTTPYTKQEGKLLIVRIFSDFASRDEVDVKQTGREYPTTPSFIKGIYQPDYNQSWVNTSDGYGLWVKLVGRAKNTVVTYSNKEEQLFDNYFKPLQLAENPLSYTPNFNQHFLCQDKDMYVVAYGDSIFAWQSTLQKPDEGVTQVPPVCDRKGFAYRLWKHIQFGSPKYRRFDYGKDELCGNFETTWANSNDPFFTEEGTWVTHYYGDSSLNSDSISKNFSAPNFTTNITDAPCPVGPFHNIENQRNIPKRLSGTSNASVTFTIPAGFTKADFIYHTHQQGDDNVTITVVEGNGKVIVKETNVDWSDLEANNHTFSMQETETFGLGYDFGLLNKRLHFKKANNSDAVTIKITKSSDTSKYMLYWGATYWGTDEEPNALHLIDTARGGHTLSNLLASKIYDVSYWNPDLVFFEHTAINSAGGDASVTRANLYNNDLVTFYNFMQNVCEMITALPNSTTTLNSNYPKQTRVFWNYIKWKSIELGLPVIDFEMIMREVYAFENPNNEKTYVEWLKERTYDGSTHPNEKGFNIFETILKPIFKEI